MCRWLFKCRGGQDSDSSRQHGPDNGSEERHTPFRMLHPSLDADERGSEMIQGLMGQTAHGKMAHLCAFAKDLPFPAEASVLTRSLAVAFLFSGGGEGEEEDGAMGQFAFGADGTAVGEHDVFGDGEAEAGASGFTGAGFIDAVKAFEQAREMFGSDAGAEILDEEFDGVRDSTGSEDDSSARGSVFQGIVDQVGEDLMNGFAVGQDLREIFRQRVGSRD